MKKMLLGCLLVAAAATSMWAAEGTQIAGLHERAEEFKAAWSLHDAKALAALWAEDGDLINPFGRVAKGRAEVEKLFHDEQTTAMKASTFNILSESSREIAPDVAVADWDSEVTGIQGPGGAMPPFKNHVSVVWVKKGGQWWIASARAAAFAPPPGAGKPMM